MSDASTTRMIDLYMEDAPAPMFLSGFFQSPPANFHNTEKVEIDIVRDDEDIAIAIQDLSVDGRENENTLYTNKGFTPPIFDEIGTIHALDMQRRLPGQTPFTDPNFALAATEQSFRIFRKLEKKIRRVVEYMASQVLQTGAVTLVDNAGNPVYVLDFAMKATHKITVGTTWAPDGTTGDPMGDLAAAGVVVRRDGKKNPRNLIFGTSAMNRFLANPKVQKALELRRMNLGDIAPQMRGEGATFYGRIVIEHYEYLLWMYDGYYKHPVTSVLTPYVGSENVIMMSEGGRLDLTYGGIPFFGEPEQRVLPFLPERMSSGARGLDLNVNAWITANRRQLKVSASARPLTIPTAIDTFAVIDVTA